MSRKLLITLLLSGMLLSISAFDINKDHPLEDVLTPDGGELYDNPIPDREDQGSTDGVPNFYEEKSNARTIYLKSRQFKPSRIDHTALSKLANSGKPRIHVLVQLDFIPKEIARAELEPLGLKLLAYIPDHTWIATVTASEVAGIQQLPGFNWMGELKVIDKLDPAILSESWGPHNLSPDGRQAAVYVVLHKDEEIEMGKSLVAAYGGVIKSAAYGINLLIVEMPKDNIHALASEDAVQWIEPAGIPLGEANDGIRPQIGVDTVNDPPYSLDGNGVNVLVYDSGQAGDHVDFGTRLTHGDAEGTREHSTHVAGTVGGSGANSLSEGGIALQWRGMAPGVDLISYGTNWSTGVLFYEDVADIEHDFAEAENTHNAHLANASLSSNIYLNNYGPDECDMMGRYGAASVLIDQIVRGGNTQVGIGDRYITTWCAGNERNSPGSCSDGHNSTSPPASAKNPIQVGASNTNNNTMTVFSSWGPTEDGRIKPIVTAGGCQSNGDLGITSTDNNPVDDYTVMCGTSMASPAVAGGIALMLEHYRDSYSVSGEFWPSTAKALLMHTADDLGNPGPDYSWGYGQVDIHAAVDLISTQPIFEESISQGDVDVYYLPVTDSTDPLTVSMAWDDFEATFNASPTLINNLDLELVNPGGTIVRPWILDPDNPGDNATTGIDNNNNQEQVMVLNPDVGTWMIRVKGTTVPQGPQDYSLICEGCQSLYIGDCQSLISSETVGSAVEINPSEFGQPSNMEILPERVISNPILTEGEIWQGDLEAGKATHKSDGLNVLTFLEDAHLSDLENITGFLSDPEGISPERVFDEIKKVLDQTATNLPLTETDNGGIDAIDRVGINGACSHSTIQSAVTSASPGDLIQVSAGVYFENVDISGRSLIIEGDYDSTCTVKGGGETRIEGSLGLGSTLEIINSKVTLEDLTVAWGINLVGGGILAQNSTVVLDNVDVTQNYALAGGGIYVDPDSDVTLVNSTYLIENAAITGGGGAGVEGELISTLSTFSDNCAPDGGGIYTLAGDVQLETTAMVLNQAAGSTGKGGGIWADGGSTVQTSATTLIGANTATNGGGLYLEGDSTIVATDTFIGFPLIFLWPNLAEYGAGIYADSSTVDFSGSIDLNVAEYSGAGIYSANSSIVLTDATIGGNSESYQGNQLGSSGHYGAGLYLAGGSLAILDNTSVVSNTFQTTGTTYGGGIYATGSSFLTLGNNSTVEDHEAPSATEGRGGGIYLDGSTLTLDNSHVISNTAGTVGGGIRMWGVSTLNIQNGASISYNRSLNGEGGAVAATGTPTINLTGGTLQHNRSSTDGGAFFLDAGYLNQIGWWDLRWNRADGNGGAVAILGSANVSFHASTGTSYLGVNVAQGNGGAIYVNNTDYVTLYADDGYQLLMNTNIAGADGGAVFADSGAFIDVFGDVQATSNIADGNGGAFYLSGESYLWLDDYNDVFPTILVNTADNGGAIFAAGDSGAQCDGALFGGGSVGNEAVVGNGGAVYLNGSTFHAYNCEFQNNMAYGNGGAIYANNDSTIYVGTDFPTHEVPMTARDAQRVTAPDAPTACDPSVVECSSFHDNAANSESLSNGNGGAIYISDSIMAIDYTHLHHNSAYMGGAIYQTGTVSSLEIRNSLIHHNSVTHVAGSGVRTYEGILQLYHASLSDNTGAAAVSSEAATSQVYNSIIWGNTSGYQGTYSAATCNIDQNGAVGSSIDPLFVNPAGENYRLSIGSKAVDVCPGGLTPDLDKRGRPSGSNFDMGAYELMAPIYLPLIVR